MTKLKFALAFLVLGIFAGPRAQAEVVLLEQSGLVSGSQSFVYEFRAPSAGTVNVQLSNLNWPERLASVSFVATSATSVLTPMSGVGITTFDVLGPGAYFAHVAGVAQGALDLGLYSLRITFDGIAAPVPLPAGVWLLLSGLGALGLPLRRRIKGKNGTPAS